MKTKTILKITPKGRPNAGATAKGETKKKADKKATSKATPAKPKRISALDAAAIVLKKASKPMRSQEMITAMAEQKLWSSPNGRTPASTLYAAVLREIATKGKEARFKKVDRGQFEFIG